MDYNDFYAELNIQLGDSADTTFTPEEKQRALDKAFKDSYVVEPVLDTTTVWAASTFSYPIPTTLTTITDVYYNYTADNSSSPINSNLYEVYGGNIVFRPLASNIFVSGSAVYLKGNYKYTKNDTIPNGPLQEYILATAGFNTLSLLGYKKANLFLKNDTTMSEVIALRREFDAERKELRAKLQRAWESA